MKSILKKTLTALLSLTFACAAAACGSSEKGGDDSTNSSENSSVENSSQGQLPDIPEVDYGTYGSYWFPQHDYKTMPVGAYNATPPAKYGYTKNFLIDEEIFKAYAEAGVNTVMGLTDYVGLNQQDVATALDYCYDYDLAYLLAYSGASSVSSENAVRGMLATVMYHDNFAGIMHYDEPGRVAFEEITKSRTVFESVLKDTSEKLYHVNLFPTYANEKQLWFRNYTAEDEIPGGSYTYGQYLADYMEICKPQVLSYDFYPITGQFPKLANGYFENMSVIRKAALQANIPFWVYIQTCSFANNQRLSTQADLDWNVNTCLAYGAKGIQYFCGVCPQDGNEIFKGAMFDVNGNKTEMYERVRLTTKMIAAADEILMCAKHKGVIVQGVMPQLNGGEERMTIPEEDLLENFNELQSVTANHALIGCFDYNGKTALYVVNNAIADDTVAGCTAADRVTLTFGKEVRGYTLDAEQKTPFAGNTLSAELGAGKATLVVLE